MAILYGTMQNGQLVAVEADSQGRLVAQLADPVDPSNFVAINGSTMTGNLTVPSLNDGPLGGFRNQIINGNFSVQQRYTNAAAWQGLSDSYVSDRWRTGGTLLDVAWLFGTDDLPFRSRTQITNRSAGANSGLSQLIELPGNSGYGHFFSGSKFTLSFWSDKALAASGSEVSVDIYDFSSLASVEGATVTSLGVVEGPLSGFSRYAYSVEIPNYTYSANYCVRVNIFQGSQAVGTKFTLTGVQLEPGPVATPFEHRPIGTELALCQRYYQKLNEVTGVGPVGLTQAQNTTRMVCFLPTKCTMRAAPSVGLPSTANFQLQVNDSVFGDIDFAVDQSCPSGVFVLAQPNAGNANRFTVGGSGRLFTLNASAGSFTADAEL